ncbi:MAG: ribulose-phosphate 3-epimerase [Candidatus Woesearchaeota archaeon]
MKKIVASIIASNQEGMEQRIDKVKDAVEIIQLDIMDGKFAPTKSIDFDFTIPKISCTIEADLMVQNPKSWIEKHSDKVDLIIVHMESTDDIIGTINLIKSKGKKAALALDPITPAQKVLPYLDSLDMVMVFTADKIGYYGSAFNPDALEKIKNIKFVMPSIAVEVDGGVNLNTIKPLSDAGVDFFVSGSYLQKSEDAKQAVKNLMELTK